MATSFMEKSKTALARTAQSAQSRLKSMREQTAEVTKEALATVETVGAGAAMAYARGRYGDENHELRVANIPVELLLGGVGKAAAFMGAFKDQGSHVQAISNGILTEWAVLMAFGMGLDAAEEG